MKFAPISEKVFLTGYIEYVLPPIFAFFSNTLTLNKGFINNFTATDKPDIPAPITPTDKSFFYIIYAKSNQELNRNDKNDKINLKIIVKILEILLHF